MTPTISYAITACNEYDELKRLIAQLEAHIGLDDEIIIQIDTSATKEVRDLLVNEFLNGTQNRNVIEFPLQKDFSTFKNNIKKFAKKDYIIYIDADEYLDEYLISNLASLLEQNPTVEMFLVPRINTVEGLIQEHIDKWNWNVDKQGRVNFPDYQSRIMKNIPEIKWIGKVHERMVGTSTYAFLPAEDHWCLIHPKTIERQEKQNNLYDTL